MEKYIIEWDAGSGSNFAEIDVEDIDEAEDFAYECWLDEADSNAKYSVVGLSTKDLREEYGLDKECEEERD